MIQKTRTRAEVSVMFEMSEEPDLLLFDQYTYSGKMFQANRAIATWNLRESGWVLDRVLVVGRLVTKTGPSKIIVKRNAYQYKAWAPDAPVELTRLVDASKPDLAL